MLARKALAGTAAAPKVYVEDVFSTYLYTGTGSSQTITNNIDISGEGGLVWIKGRSSATGYRFTDTARGATKSLESNSTALEATESTGLTAFSGTGFTIGADADYNTNTDTYASWTFRKAKKFFDVVTYSGNGTAGRQISHNLGSVPGVIIVKVTSGSANDWQVYHRSVGNTKYLRLNTTDTPSTATSRWNDTDPTSTYFVVGNNSSVNSSGNDYVAYLFAHDAGGFGSAGDQSIISCGSYTGNGSATGPEINLGWEPQWLLVKSTTVTGSHWYLMDTMRGMAFNGSRELYPNLTATDTAQTKNVIPTATGFQVVTTDGYLNNNGSTYVYIAIRRGPMKTPTVGTSVFSPVVYTGTSAAQTITTNFPVDMFWNKTRVAGPGSLMDRTRGQLVLRTEGTFSEAGIGTYLSTTNVWRNNTGLSFGDSGSDGLNADGTTAVIEAFRRAPGFFDVVCYTGTGSAGLNVTHNLGVVPEMMIVKRRSAAEDWGVYHSALGNTKGIYLNYNLAADTQTIFWNNTSPTATQFTLGSWIALNTNGGTHVAYLFASVSGVSKVGSYTGTGTTLQVNCGFTSGARFVLIKRTDSTGDWYVWDTARGIVSGNDPYLLMNSQNAEVTNTDYIDPYSSGFEISSTAPAAINANGGTFIYLAIA